MNIVQIVFAIVCVVILFLCIWCFCVGNQIESSPPDISELGNATWTFLHSMAANYPDQPNDQDKILMSNLINSIVQFYPCYTCRSNLESEVQELYPDVSSNYSLQMWLCKLHNKINYRLNKPQFPCDINLLNARWNMNITDENGSNCPEQKCRS